MPNISLMELYNKLAQQQALFGEKIERIYDVISGSLQIPMDVTNSNDYPSLWPDSGLNVYSILPEYNLGENLCTSGVLFNIGQGRYKYQMMIVQQDELHQEKNGKMYYRYAKASDDVWSGWKRSAYIYEITGGRDAEGNHYKDDFGDMLTDTEDNDPDISGEYSDEDDASAIFALDEDTGDIVITDESETDICEFKLFMNEDANTVVPVEELDSGDLYNTNFMINTAVQSEVFVTEPVVKSVTFVADRAYTADTLTTKRTISLEGAVEGICTFDGSKDGVINTTSSNLVPINVQVEAFTSPTKTYRLLCTLPAYQTSSYDYVVITGHLGGFSNDEGKCAFTISASNCGESFEANATILGTIDFDKLDIVALKSSAGEIYICMVSQAYCNVEDVKMTIIGSEKTTVVNELRELSAPDRNPDYIYSYPVLQIPTKELNTGEWVPSDGYQVWTLSRNSVRFADNVMYGNVVGNASTSDTSRRANVVNVLKDNSKELFLVGMTDDHSTHYYDSKITITENEGELKLASLKADTTQIATIVADDIVVNNTLKASVITNNTANDFAEYFPRGGQTEFGDVIMLDVNANGEKYIRAKEAYNCDKETYCVVGVQSDTYGHILGGMDGTAEENLKEYIPVGLAGRVNVKFVGKAKKGAKVVPTNNGCARMFDCDIDDVNNVIGYLVEADDIVDVDNVRRLKMKIK